MRTLAVRRVRTTKMTSSSFGIPTEIAWFVAAVLTCRSTDHPSDAVHIHVRTAITVSDQ